MATKEITLPDARRRVAQTLHVDPSPWTRDDVLWLSEQWGIFRRELDLCERFMDEIMEMDYKSHPWWYRLFWPFVDGAEWWIKESPIYARVLAAVAFLWFVAFMLGR